MLEANKIGVEDLDHDPAVTVVSVLDNDSKVNVDKSKDGKIHSFTNFELLIILVFFNF